MCCVVDRNDDIHYATETTLWPKNLANKMRRKFMFANGTWRRA